MKCVVKAWEPEHVGLKEGYSIDPGRFKQTLLSGCVILHMTQCYPNKSHILIKTGIPLPTVMGPSLEWMLKGVHMANVLPGLICRSYMAREGP